MLIWKQHIMRGSWMYTFKMTLYPITTCELLVNSKRSLWEKNNVFFQVTEMSHDGIFQHEGIH